jgi:UDP-N-acetylglucosamine 2-epimerase (non-hydrolysing)
MPKPDENLDVGSASHAQQTAAVMSKFEPVVLRRKPDIVLVYGDVNSTLAAALVCSKLGLRVAHVEAGLRSFDRSMPEETNRILTDQLADIHFTPSQDGDQNLSREGISDEKIFLVGNVMIDTLVRLLPKADESFHRLSGDYSRPFGLVTLHRPSNVDDANVFLPMLELLNELSEHLDLVFPVHPRTRSHWSAQIDKCNPRLRAMDPLGYLDFLALHKRAALVITDSGGIQEEATFLGVPCLTVRENTERPVTVSMGTNILVGHNWELLRKCFFEAIGRKRNSPAIPPLWDGHAAQRIASVLSQ